MTVELTHGNPLAAACVNAVRVYMSLPPPDARRLVQSNGVEHQTHGSKYSAPVTSFLHLVPFDFDIRPDAKMAYLGAVENFLKSYGTPVNLRAFEGNPVSVGKRIVASASSADEAAGPRGSVDWASVAQWTSELAALAALLRTGFMTSAASGFARSASLDLQTTYGDIRSMLESRPCMLTSLHGLQAVTTESCTFACRLSATLFDTDPSTRAVVRAMRYNPLLGTRKRHSGRLVASAAKMLSTVALLSDTAEYTLKNVEQVSQGSSATVREVEDTAAEIDDLSDAARRVAHGTARFEERLRRLRREDWRRSVIWG